MASRLGRLAGASSRRQAHPSIFLPVQPPKRVEQRLDVLCLSNKVLVSVFYRHALPLRRVLRSLVLKVLEHLNRNTYGKDPRRFAG